MTFSITHRLLALVLCAFLIGSFFPTSTSQAQPADPPPYKVYLPITMLNADTSWQWEAIQQVSLSPGPLHSPMTAIDSNGHLHIFWDIWPGQSQFIYHKYQTGSGWSDTEAIAQTLGASELLASPIAGADGSIYILWQNALNFGGPYRIMYASWKNGTWGPEAELHQSQYNSVGGLINLDSAGQPVAVVSSSDIMTTHYYYCRPTVSGCQGKVEIPANSAYYFDSVFVDRSGGIVLLSNRYVSSTSHEYYSYWKNIAFTTSYQDIGGSVNYREGIIDGQGNIYFIHSDSVPIPGGNVTGIYQQCLYSNRTWGANQVISGQKEVAAYQYATTASGAVVSAWQSSTSNPVVLDRWDTCSSITNKTITIPPPSSSSWGKLSSLAVSDLPKKICLVMAKQYASSEFGVYCVNIKE
jgi:hypothetical protein